MTKPAKEKELQPLENVQRHQRKQVNAWIREAASATLGRDRPMEESRCKDPGTDGAVYIRYRQRP